MFRLKEKYSRIDKKWRKEDKMGEKWIKSRGLKKEYGRV